MNIVKDICNAWKTEDWPQLTFFGPNHHTTGSQYHEVVRIGNSKPEILVPYVIKGNRITLPGASYTVSFIRNHQTKISLHEMEWIDNKGNKIFFEELMYGEPHQPIELIKLPF